MNFPTFYLILIFVLFIILLILNKKKTIRLRAQDSIIDALTFGSGLILFLYLVGKTLNIAFLTNIDEFSLLLAILIASIFLLSASADKYFKRRKKKKWPNIQLK